MRRIYETMTLDFLEERMDKRQVNSTMMFLGNSQYFLIHVN